MREEVLRGSCGTKGVTGGSSEDEEVTLGCMRRGGDGNGMMRREDIS